MIIRMENSKCQCKVKTIITNAKISAKHKCLTENQCSAFVKLLLLLVPLQLLCT